MQVATTVGEDRALDEEPGEHAAAPVTSSTPRLRRRAAALRRDRLRRSPGSTPPTACDVRLRIQRRARPELEPAVHHHPVAGAQTLGDHPLVAVQSPTMTGRFSALLSLSATQTNRPFASLEHRALRHEDRVRAHRALDAHPHVLVRPQEAAPGCRPLRGSGTCRSARCTPGPVKVMRPVRGNTWPSTSTTSTS